MTEPRVTRKKITDYRPDPSNANLSSERGHRIIDDSVSQDGAGRSGLADKNGVIIAGNQTLNAMVENGIEDVVEIRTTGKEWVIVVREDADVNDPDPNNLARRMAYRDNRSQELSLNWNPEQLLADLNTGVKLDNLFTSDELAELLARVTEDGVPSGDPGAAIDRASELRDKYGVEHGQLWQVGRHRILCGDAYSEADRARLLDGKTPDMLHIDPPYGINIVKPLNGSDSAAVGGAKPFGSTGETQRKGISAVAFRNSADHAGRGHVQHGQPSKNQWAKNHPEYMVIKGDNPSVGSANTPHAKGALSVANEYPLMKGDNVGRGNPANIIQSNLYPVIEGDDRPFDPTVFVDLAPIVIMWGANYYADKLPNKSCWICWDKREDITRNNFADGELAWTNMDKPMRIFHHLWNGLHKGSQHGERRTHPTEKPVALFAEIGKMYADKGLWLDLFGGTGAQVVAAEQTGATCYLNEIEPLYVATILERLAIIGLSPERLS